MISVSQVIIAPCVGSNTPRRGVVVRIMGSDEAIVQGEWTSRCTIADAVIVPRELWTRQEREGSAALVIKPFRG